MKKSAEDIIFDAYWMKDTIEFVNELEKKRKKDEYNKRVKYLSSLIYKVHLYKFASSKKPKYLIDGDFDNNFELSKTIYATIVDNMHVKEIKTGMIFPIVGLEKNDDKWTSSNIIYGDLNDNQSQFAISNNIKLLTGKDLKDLYTYLSYDKEIIKNYLNYEQETKSLIKK